MCTGPSATEKMATPGVSVRNKVAACNINFLNWCFSFLWLCNKSPQTLWLQITHIADLAVPVGQEPGRLAGSLLRISYGSNQNTSWDAASLRTHFRGQNSVPYRYRASCWLSTSSCLRLLKAGLRSLLHEPPNIAAMTRQFVSSKPEKAGGTPAGGAL